MTKEMVKIRNFVIIAHIDHPAQFAFGKLDGARLSIL